MMRYSSFSFLYTCIVFLLLVSCSSIKAELYEWETLSMTSTPSARSSVPIASINETTAILFGGGSTSSSNLYYFNLINFQWTQLPTATCDTSCDATCTIPSADLNHYFQPVENSLDITDNSYYYDDYSTLIVAGNFDGTRIEWYNTTSNSWCRKYELPDSNDILDSSAITSYDSSIWMFGGATPASTTKRELFRYNFTDDPGFSGSPSPWGVIDFTIFDDWPAETAQASLVHYSDQLWLFGGLLRDPVRAGNDLWVFTPSTSTFSQITATSTWPGVRYGHSALVAGSSMFIFGGQDDIDSNSPNFYNDVWRWDFGSSSWEDLSSLISGTPPSSRGGVSTALYDQWIYYIFGRDSSSTFSDGFRLQWAADRIIFSTLIADDPDDADAVYSDGDTLSLHFTEPTNQPDVSTKAAIDTLFSFSLSLGTDYSGSWQNSTWLQLTIIDSTGHASPDIGSLNVTIISGLLQDAASTSLQSSDTSPPLIGDWGLKPGPNITTLLANDPDDADGIFSNGDTLSLLFNEATNQPLASTKAQIDALFSFSTPLGSDYTGSWTSSSQLDLTITNATMPNPSIDSDPELGAFNLTILSTSLELLDAAGTSLPSTSISALLSGDWGLLPGPHVDALIADDPDDGDGVFSPGDTLTFYFDQATNQPNLTTKAQLDSFMTSDWSFGSDYSGSWTNSSVLVITFNDVTGHTLSEYPTFDIINVTISSSVELRSADNLSLVSSGLTRNAVGSWGELAGPAITSFYGLDFDNGDGIYSTDDIITLVFDTNTNEPDVSSKSAVDTLLTFSQTLGTDYTGLWFSPSTLLINIDDATAATPPDIGSLTVSVNLAANLRSSATYPSLPSTVVSSPITGDWGTYPGPAVTTLLANDPDDLDGIFSVGDTLWLVFNEPTNMPDINTTAQVDAFFDFSQPLTGSTYSGYWLNSTLFQISIDTAGSFEPSIGSWNVSIVGTLLNQAEDSLSSDNSTSPNLSGDWGLLAGPSVLSFVANDPDDGDAVYSNDDTVELYFNEATNTPTVSTKSDIDLFLNFSSPIATDYTGTWSNSSLLVITLSDTSGLVSDPMIGSLTVDILDTNGVTLKNAGDTSLASVGSSPLLSGNWGLLEGPNITRLQGVDPDNNDSVFSNDDALIVTFSEPTNEPPASSKAEIDALFSMSSVIGASYSGVWTTSSVLTITILDISTASPSPPDNTTFTLTVLDTSVGLQNAAETSLNSTAISPLLESNWGNGPLCAYSNCTECTNAVNDCIWCASQGTCLDGDAGGPFYTTCDRFYTTSGTCPACTATNCYTCNSNADCGWCRDTQTCGEGGSSGPFLGASCSTWYYDDTCPAALSLADSLVTTENGASVAVEVSLELLPTADVTVTMYTDDTTEGSLSPTSLTFSTSTWNVNQTVTVTGLPDATVDGDVVYGVYGVASSADLTYEASVGNTVNLTNLDANCCQLETAVAAGYIAQTSEDGSQDTIITAVLTSAPSADVHFAVSVSDADEAVVNITEIYYTPSNYSSKVGIYVDGLDDLIDDGDVSYTIQFAGTSTDILYSGAVINSLAITSIDNDTAVINLSLDSGMSLLVNESDTTSALTGSIYLSTEVASTTIIQVAADDSSEAIVSPTNLTFTSSDWSVPQSFSIYALDDDIDDGDIAFEIVGTGLSGDPAHIGLSSAGGSISLTNINNDTTGYVLEPDQIWNIDENAGAQTFELSLSSEPLSGSVIVPLTSSDTTEFTVSPLTATFDTSNWSTPQTVTITPIDDNLVDGDQSVSLLIGTATAAGDAQYAALAQRVVSVNINDTNIAAVIGAVSSSISNEDKTATAVISVSLSSSPSVGNTVSVNVYSSDTTEAVTVPNPYTLVFSDTTWNIAQDVYFNGEDDNEVDGTVPYTAVFSTTSSGDPNYSGLTTSSLNLFNQDNDVATIDVSATEGSVDESGTGFGVDVTLSAQPSDNVTIALVSSSDTTEGIVSPSSLEFSPSDWSIAQTVTVTGVDDPDIDGTVSYSVAFSSASSTDGNWNGVTRSALTFNTTDDDAAGIVVGSQTGLIDEDGNSATLPIQLAARPTTTVTVSISSGDTGEATVSPSTMTFGYGNYNVDQTLTVTGVDDFIADGNITVTLSFSFTSTDTDFSGVVDSTTVTVYDNDTPSITAGSPAGSTSESGASTTIDVRLATLPTDDVVIAVSSSNTAEGQVTPTSLTFTTSNFNTIQQITVVGWDDDYADGDINFTVDFVATSTDSSYNGLTASSTVTNIDDDSASIVVSTISDSTEESGANITATFTVEILARPAIGSTVSVSFLTDDASEGYVSSTNPISFTDANWQDPITVTVTGVDDDVDDGSFGYNIDVQPAVSTDPAYSGLAATPSSVAVINIDDDEAGITVSNLGTTSLYESSTSSTTFEVTLNSEPTADVVVNIVNYDPTDASVTPTSITFSSLDWNAPRLVTVTAIDDSIDDGDSLVTILVGHANTTDTKYSGISATPNAHVLITVIDDDDSQLIITPNTIYTSENGDTGSFTVTLSSSPSDQVDLAITSDNSTEAYTLQSTSKLLASTWSTGVTITVVGVDDSNVDGPIWYTCSLTTSSSDSNYNGLTASVNMINFDNDGSGNLQISPPLADLNESGTTTPVYFALNADPGGTVTVNVGSGDTTEATVSLSSTTFDSSNFDTPQLVTISSVDDFIADGDIDVTISASIVAGLFAAETQTTNVIVLDDDVVGYVLGSVVGSPDEVGNSATFTVRLGALPANNVIVAVTSSDTSELTVSPSSITFTTANWNVDVSVTVTGVADDLNDGDQSASISLTASSSDTQFDGLSTAFSLTNTNIRLPSISTIEPAVTVLAGDALVITGEGFREGCTVEIGGTDAGNVTRFDEELTPRSRRSRDRNSRAIDETRIGVDAPPLAAGYHDVVITNTDGTSVTLTNYLYYTVTCAEVGVYTSADGLSCLECPEGAYCPGGDRLWPEPGHWTTSEFASFVWSCWPEDRCAGGQNALCNTGYEGDYCGACSSGYYRSGDLCMECPSSTASGVISTIVFILWILIVFVVFIAVGNHMVWHFVWALLGLQLLRSVVYMSSRLLPLFMREIYLALSLVSMDYGFLRPGCGVGDNSFGSLFWGNLALFFLVLLAYFILQAAAISFGGLYQEFGLQAYRGGYLLCLIFYLNLTFHALQAVHCVETPDGVLHLHAQFDVVCYTGTHTGTAIFGWLFIAVFGLGLPIFSTWTLLRIGDSLDDETAQTVFGSLYSTFEPEFPFLGVAWIWVLTLLAVVGSFMDREPFIQFLVSEGVYLLTLIYLLWNHPFLQPTDDGLVSLCCVGAAWGGLVNFIGSPVLSTESGLIVAGSILTLVLIGLSVVGWIAWLLMHSRESEGTSKPAFYLNKMAKQPVVAPRRSTVTSSSALTGGVNVISRRGDSLGTNVVRSEGFQTETEREWRSMGSVGSVEQQPRLNPSLSAVSLSELQRSANRRGSSTERSRRKEASRARESPVITPRTNTRPLNLPTSSSRATGLESEQELSFSSSHARIAPTPTPTHGYSGMYTPSSTGGGRAGGILPATPSTPYLVDSMPTANSNRIPSSTKTARSNRSFAIPSDTLASAPSFASVTLASAAVASEASRKHIHQQEREEIASMRDKLESMVAESEDQDAPHVQMIRQKISGLQQKLDDLDAEIDPDDVIAEEEDAEAEAIAAQEREMVAAYYAAAGGAHYASDGGETALSIDGPIPITDDVATALAFEDDDDDDDDNNNNNYGYYQGDDENDADDSFNASEGDVSVIMQEMIDEELARAELDESDEED